MTYSTVWPLVKWDSSTSQERGKRPVLFLSLRTIKENNWGDAYTRMVSLLSRLSEEISQKAPVAQLTYDQQDILQKVIRKQAKPVECESILAILTRLLTLKHNGMTPWVCIDEYDAPMQSAYQHKYYEEMRNLMKGLLGDCLKDNPFLHRAVLTGIVRVAKEDIFSDLNNLGVFGVLNNPFCSWFGFTEHEVKQLLQQRRLSERFAAVRKAYNGYRFGNSTMYNPWSVINDLRQPASQPGLYWVNTSTNHLVHELLTQANTEVKEGLHELLSAPPHDTTTQMVQEHVPLREVKNDGKNLWGLLLASGYLTAVQARENPDNVNKIVQLRIPNDEVRRVYNGLVNRWLRGPAEGMSGIALVEALVKGQVEEFAVHFERFVLESVSYFDEGARQPERFYHGFVLGMMHHLRDRYRVDSQRESGLGRYDLALEPKDKTLPGFIMEFKTSTHKNTPLTDTAEQSY